jgi:pyruvate formate lyase activating enzyme
MERDLIVGGFVPFTTIDFPGVNFACVVFCQGCHWRCPYCQNKNLQPQISNYLFEHGVFKQICERKGLLDGVVFSGGEPLAQLAIIEAVSLVKNEGFKVALHTSGAVPTILKKVLPMIDWVGLDIKAPFSRYDDITKYEGSSELIKQSLKILVESNLNFECRTTIDPDLLNRTDLLQIASELKIFGVKNFAIQACFDDARNLVYSDCFSKDFLDELRQIFPEIIVRNIDNN